LEESLKKKCEKNGHSVTQLRTGENVIPEPWCTAENFAYHFCSVFNSSSPVIIPDNTHFTLASFFNIPSIYDSDVKQAIRRLSSSKCVGPNEILNFIHVSPLFHITFSILVC
jgi:hypothetical protein